ncbi:MAG: FAD binding domain-containing protein [Anaerolineales bacterium]|nr:FAD binding domain-containing protein [Anaerolineales bacterium]
MWQDYYTAATLDEAVDIIEKISPGGRIVAGATDLILELERGLRPEVKSLVDITRIPALNRITLDENGAIHLGPLVTHNHCVASPLIREKAFPLWRAAWEIGAPQIRNRGTVAGNLITASPANDTITPLMALDAWVELKSRTGARRIPLKDFYRGVRQTVMEPNEILVDICFPAMQTDQSGTFIKLALRRAQAISVVNVAILLTTEKKRISRAAITLGSVAPTIIHALEAEKSLEGQKLEEKTIAQAAILAMQASRPIDDIRGSAVYRREMVRVCTARGLRTLRDKKEQAGLPSDPVLLWDQDQDLQAVSRRHTTGSAIDTIINGKEYTFTSGHEKTLLRLLREEANLTGTKEGCAEGECGACTVFLDGKAVMACLIPAPRAHGAEIVTIEGLGTEEQLHPVQSAFVQDAAVQCGYCTPGFIMSAAMLLREKGTPTRDQINQALTGNLCRCTGYYKIVRAIEDASSPSA